MLGDLAAGGGLAGNDQELMAKMDVNGDAYLDPGELEELLRRTKLYEHFSVKELISRFDADVRARPVCGCRRCRCRCFCCRWSALTLVLVLPTRACGRRATASSLARR